MNTKVYLSGGLRSNWQSKVETIEGLYFINPRNKEKAIINPLTAVEQYVLWDLQAIRQCDIVFAYMEYDNPSGIGLSVEIGFAKALGKTVILVLEPNKNLDLDRYLLFVKMTADICLDTLEEGMNFLRSLSLI